MKTGKEADDEVGVVYFGERMSMSAAVSEGNRIMLNAMREAEAIHFSEKTGNIEIDDVYMRERGAGAPRTQLGSSSYERLLYVSRSEHVAHVGAKSTTSTREIAARDELESSATSTTSTREIAPCDERHPDSTKKNEEHAPGTTRRASQARAARALSS